MRRVGLTYQLGPVLSVRDPAGESDTTTTTVRALCPRALSLGDAVFSLWVLGLGVLLRGPSMAQTEPARGRASLLRAFGQVTPVLLQVCQLARPPAPVPESQGEGRDSWFQKRTSRWAACCAAGSRRRPVRKLPACLAAPEVERGGRAGEGAVGRFPQVLVEPALPSPRRSDLTVGTTAKILAGQQPKATEDKARSQAAPDSTWLESLPSSFH